MSENTLLPHDQPLIHIKHLKKFFGDNKVLKDISLKVYEGNIFTILGRSGTGKSVLLKCLIHLLRSDSGEIWYQGKDLNALSDSELSLKLRSFAYLFQESALFDSLSVEENIAFPIREALKITDKHYIKNRVRELLQWVDLPNTEHLSPSELSGGMKKRVGVARTLAMNPSIMLCDEPTTGLDPVTGKIIMDLIYRANKELGITCIIISHNIPGTIQISNNIALLEEGIIQFMGTREELLQSNNMVIKSFIENISMPQPFSNNLTK